jgi:hypothetical protein
MNNQKILYIWLFITSLLLSGCASSRKTDDTIDACKLTEPPTDAYVTDAGHLGRSFTYPAPIKIPANYSGCVKGWIGDDGSPPKSFLVASIRFNNGLVSYIESFDPDGVVVICEFDGNEMLIKETLIKKHYAGCMELLPTAREFVDGKGLTK